MRTSTLTLYCLKKQPTTTRVNKPHIISFFSIFLNILLCLRHLSTSHLGLSLPYGLGSGNQPNWRLLKRIVEDSVQKSRRFPIRFLPHSIFIIILIINIVVKDIGQSLIIMSFINSILIYHYIMNIDDFLERKAKRKGGSIMRNIPAHDTGRKWRSVRCQSCQKVVKYIPKKGWDGRLICNFCKTFFNVPSLDGFTQ
jgi:hypothetical protein